MRANSLMLFFTMMVTFYASGSEANSTIIMLPNSSSPTSSFPPPPTLPTTPTFPAASIQSTSRAVIGVGPGNNYIAVPGGGHLLPKSCYDPLPNGSLIDENKDVWLDGKRLKHLSACAEPEIVPSANGWVEASTQEAYTYFVSMLVEFYVPASPSSNDSQNTVFIWPGIEAVTTSPPGYWLAQPVLQWNQAGDSGIWYMQDWIVHNDQYVASDYGGQVYPGDLIEAAVFMDTLNPGSSCAYGQHCNYWSAWWDVTSGHATSGGFEYNIPTPMNWAQGAVLEVAGNFYSCNDLPGNGVFGTLMTPFFNLAMYDAGGCGSPPCAVTPNLTNNPYPDWGTLYFENGQAFNCPFFDSSGYWIGSNYGTALGY